jgi:predicted anti-sigma-YlaC factor YlaD
MHEPVRGRLEGYLRAGSGYADVEEHLRNCEGCRNEVNAMRAQAGLFKAIQPPSGIEPGPGFYARVMNRVETDLKPSPWSLFGDSLFAKRLAYASVTFLVLMGTVLVSSTESEDMVAAETTPEVILAGEHWPAQRVSMDDLQRDREVVLVNLATYQQDYQ